MSVTENDRDRLGGCTRAGLLRGAAGAAVGVAAAGRAPAAAVAAAPTVGHFVSRRDLVPPVITVLRHTGRTAPGHLFLAPSSGPGQRGALIVDNRGEVIWFRPVHGRTVMNFRPALYKGQPVLTWWEGETKDGLGDGDHVVVDRSYREIARFPAGDKRPSDLHEFLLTPRGTALVTSWETVTGDLSGIGGPSSAKVVGGVLQEIEIPSARVLFEWRSVDHVAFSESHSAPGAHFDYFHINSIDPGADGSFLVSARNTWALYKIDRDTGQVVWRIGGKKSDFEMGRGTVFAWQHDARHHGVGHRVSLFDDGAAPKVEPQSRAIVIDLDTVRMRATLVQQYTRNHHAHALGSMQLLPNGDALVGWGTAPFFTEYSGDGKIVFDAALPKDGENYRALRYPWSGRPAAPPALVGRPASNGFTLYASWNGATDVADWQVHWGTGRTPVLTRTVTRPKQGFETPIFLPKSARFATVTALDRARKPLGRSATIRLR